MTEVTNNTDGPRAVHTIAGEVFFAKGQTKNVEFAPGGATAARMIGLDVDGDEPDAESAPAIDMDKALEAARTEVAQAAQRQLDEQRDSYAEKLKAAEDRADEAEKALAEANDEIAALKAATKPDRPGLTGKSKAELLAIAKSEGVEIEDGATNDDIKSAIELHREG